MALTNAPEVAGHQDHIPRLDGDVGARADGDSDVGLRQGGSIVDAVADESDSLSFLFQASLRGPSDRAALRPDLDRCRPARRWQSAVRLMIAGDHGDGQPEVVELLNRLSTSLLERVGNGENGDQRAIDGCQDRGLALL